jgi:hypothetical protein
VDNLSEDKMPKWRKLYETAVLETNRPCSKNERWRQRMPSCEWKNWEGGADHHDERGMLYRAATALQVLRDSAWAI